MRAVPRPSVLHPPIVPTMAGRAASAWMILTYAWPRRHLVIYELVRLANEPSCLFGANSLCRLCLFSPKPHNAATRVSRLDCLTARASPLTTHHIPSAPGQDDRRNHISLQYLQELLAPVQIGCRVRRELSDTDREHTGIRWTCDRCGRWCEVVSPGFKKASNIGRLGICREGLE